MKIYLDTASVKEIQEAASLGILDGVTTNPSLVAKEGRSFREVLLEVCGIVDGPISAEVVSVDVAVDTIKITFDSDLDPATVTGGVLLLDSKGNQVDATASYATRTVTLSGLSLTAGAQYRLVVLTTVRDVLGHNVATEYDLNVFGPSPKKHANRKENVTLPPTPRPSASAGASS